MSFIISNQQTTNDHSNCSHQLLQPSDATYADTGGDDLKANQSQGTLRENNAQLDPMETHAQSKKALNQRRSLDVNLDPALFQRLKQVAGDQQQQQQQQQQQYNVNKDATTVSGDSTNTAMGIKGTKNQVNKLKSSFRQVSSAPGSPPPHQQQESIYSNSNRSIKSVKFHRLHLEKVCIFQGTHSPNQVPRSDEIKIIPFKVLYSQRWPPIQQTLFQHQCNVQLKRSLKVLDGGSTLHGQVLVRNLGYEKEVEIRYTLDGWQTVHHVMAEYRHSRGALDTFIYDIPMEQHGMADRGYLRATVDLAVRYTVAINNGGGGNSNSSSSNDKQQQLSSPQRSPRHYQHGEKETFWDNNDGHNYQVQVVETSEANNSTRTTSSVPGSALATTATAIIGGEDPSLQLPLASSSRSRYDFGQSLIKAKHKTKLSSNTNNNDLPASDTPPPQETQSAPSSPPISEGFCHSNTGPSLASSSYSDLVKKYCFYGSQDTSSPSPALSING